MSSSHRVIEDFINLQKRNAMVHGVRVAVELGILRALASGQRSLPQLADELNLQLVPLQKLMNVLENTELIERYQEDFALSSLARLIPEPYLSFGDECWRGLGEWVRTGKSVPAKEVNIKQSTADQEPVAHGLSKRVAKGAPGSEPDPMLDYRLQKMGESWLLTPQALEVAQLLDMGRSRRSLRILEIGSGSAVFSATLAHQDPNSVINLVDTSLGAEKSRKTIDSLSLQRQAEVFEVGDLLQLDAEEALVGQKFDLIILPGLIHLFDDVQLDRLLGQIVKLAKKSSEIAIVDVFSGKKGGEAMHAIFELELLLRTGSGQLHTPQRLTLLLEKAGFRDVQFAFLPSAPQIWGLFLARIAD